MRNLTAPPGQDVSAQTDAPARTPIAPVVLTIPADKTLVVLARSAASHLAALAGLTVTELDDFRLAIGEACGLILLSDEAAVPGKTLECRFTEADGALRVSISADVRPGTAPQAEGFGWSLLNALVDEAQWTVDGARVVISLVKRPTVQGR